MSRDAESASGGGEEGGARRRWQALLFPSNTLRRKVWRMMGGCERPGEGGRAAGRAPELQRVIDVERAQAQAPAAAQLHHLRAHRGAILRAPRRVL